MTSNFFIVVIILRFLRNLSDNLCFCHAHGIHLAVTDNVERNFTLIYLLNIIKYH